MIEIKSVEREPEETIEISIERLKDFVKHEEMGLRFYSLLKLLITERYIENYACFGYGGHFTCEELAELLNIKLPKVAHIGMDAWLQIKNEKGVVENGQTKGK